MTTNQELDVNARGVLSLSEGASLADVAKALTAPLTTAPNVTVTDEIAGPTITTKVRTAIEQLPSVFGRVVLTEKRQLAPVEVEEAYREYTTIEAIRTFLSDRREALREYVRVSLDKRAEEDGRVSDDSPRTADGHYILSGPQRPERLPVPGTDKEFSNEYRQGSVDIDPKALDALYEAGEIDRATYLSFTREVRVFDEDKARKAILKDPSKIELLKKITRRGAPTQGLYVRKAKVEDGTS